jgi:hypothetical protein
MSKVIAAAGAAATTAVVGSFFGSAGTVAGAAIGSVVTTIATTLYQRSFERTREIALQRVKLPGRDTTVLAAPVDPLATIPLQRKVEQSGPAMVEPVLPAAARSPWLTRKRLLIGAGTTVLAFVIGLFVITGVEWVKGSTITGHESGTSVSRVVTGTGDEQRQDPGGTDTTETTTPPTTTRAPDPQRQQPGTGSGEETGGTSPSARPTTTSQAPVTSTTQAPQRNPLLGGGADATG